MSEATGTFEYDVFLSYNSQDGPAVLKVAERLKASGLRVWLDMWELAPGRPWQQELERAVASARAAAVLVGRSGIGPWQNEEMRAFIMSFVERRCPVIPVLLPEVATQVALPIFLAQFSWVDLREGVGADGLNRLIWGITGRQPPRARHAPALPTGDVGRPLQLEEVFCTSGLPAYTYVEPAIYRQVASDLRQHGKHILVAGPSGSGKTCLVFRLLGELGLATMAGYDYISALQKDANRVVLQHLAAALKDPSKRVVVVDDFHLLKRATRIEVGFGLKYLADLAFARAEVPKFILIGISSSPAGLLVNAPDLGPRLGVYRMPLALPADLMNIVRRGQERLSVEFANADDIVDESCGSYFICQFLCKEICLENRVDRTAGSLTVLDYDINNVRLHVMEQLEIRFRPMLSAFIMSNGPSVSQCMPTLILVAAISGIPKSLITLDEIAGVAGEFADFIRAMKNSIPDLIHSCVPNGKFSRYLYCEEDSDLFSVEDPVFRYFLNNLDLGSLMESLGIPRERRSHVLEIYMDSVARYALGAQSSM